MNHIETVVRTQKVVWAAREFKMVTLFDEETKQRYRNAALAYYRYCQLHPTENRCKVALHVGEIVCTEAGTVGLRGPSVPKFPLPPEIDSVAKPAFAVGADGLADTGFPCVIDPATRTLTISGPPAGIVGVGGYRFAEQALGALAAEIEPEGRIAAQPDALAGQRLAGSAPDAARMREALAARGVNPLIVAAFALDHPAASL